MFPNVAEVAIKWPVTHSPDSFSLFEKWLPFGGGDPATGFPRSSVDSRPRRFVARTFYFIGTSFLSSAIDFSSVGTPAAAAETQT